MQIVCLNWRINRGLLRLNLPPYCIMLFGNIYVCPTLWNFSLDRLHDPTLSFDSFKKELRTELLASY